MFAFPDAPSIISSTISSNSSVLSAAGSVSSSGYQSPSVITLDSPSPPTSPNMNANRPACMMDMVSNSYINPTQQNINNSLASMSNSVANMYNSIGQSMPFLDVDESNGASSYFPNF